MSSKTIDLKINSNSDKNIKTLSSKLPAQYNKLKFQSKTSIWQLLTSLIILIFFICLVVCMVAIYLFQTPDIVLKSTVLLNDPRFVIGLNNLPKLDFHTTINIVIVNNNIMPAPIHVIYEGSFHTDSLRDRIVYGEVYNQLLIPKSNLNTVITSDITFDLLEPNMYSITKIFDACGVFGGGRSPLTLKIWAKIKLGYGVISIPIREAVFPRVEIPCPLLEENFGQLVIGTISKLIPYEEQYNNTLNNNDMGDNPAYIPL